MLKVVKKCCKQCLFSKNKIVSDKRKEQVIKHCLENRTNFICHKTNTTVCRSFYNKHVKRDVGWAERLGLIEFIDTSENANILLPTEEFV